MKKHSISASFFATALLAACGASNTASSLNSSGTANDLPKPILKCVETQDNIVVLDGRAELTVSKDQFGIFYVKVVQRDQFAGDRVLADLSNVMRLSAGLITTFQTETPDLTLSVAVTNSTKAHLNLATRGQPSRGIDFVCKGSAK